ncbi:hypothetical protein D9758_003137 [Tetrapyrgos nigripes]|uniref:UBC core domain-containing protein n=1 Tax=Tetrapyrgos nigripes TaxID=182062 RepID=A0A8H5GJ58_9AGAR|nr:hypothetical protein D9758_003137 [Tetrapyrgos nigripes]
MSSASAMNKNNSAVKRIMQEARELANDPSTDYTAAPLEDDIFEWHCTLRGTPGTEFEGGLYHTRILLPAEYPFRPPSVMLLTPNGRFELNTKARSTKIYGNLVRLFLLVYDMKLKLDVWVAWGIRTAIVGLQSFFPLKGQAAVGVGGIEYPVSERKRLAALSRDWTCPHCQQSNLELLPDPPSSSSTAVEPETREPQTTETMDVPSADTTSTFPTVPLEEPAGPLIEPQLELGPAISVVQADSSAESSDSSSPQAREDPTTHADPSSVIPESAPLSVQTRTQTPAHASPWILDAVIGLILSLVAALIYRRL